MIATRRSFLIGIGSVLAAPAIVHAGNIMPVSSRHLMTNEEIAAALVRMWAETNALLHTDLVLFGGCMYEDFEGIRTRIPPEEWYTHRGLSHPRYEKHFARVLEYGDGGSLSLTNVRDQHEPMGHAATG